MIPTQNTAHPARRAPCPAVGAIQEAIHGVVGELRRIQARIAELCSTCAMNSRAASSGSPTRGGSAATCESVRPANIARPRRRSGGGESTVKPERIQ